MKKARVLFVAATVAVFGMLPALSSPAQAAHTCGLEELPEVNTICENYHSPKPLLQYLFCLASPTC